MDLFPGVVTDRRPRPTRKLAVRSMEGDPGCHRNDAMPAVVLAKNYLTHPGIPGTIDKACQAAIRRKAREAWLISDKNNVCSFVRMLLIMLDFVNVVICKGI